MNCLNMSAKKEILNPVTVTMSESELDCLKSILHEFFHMKERDDFDSMAVQKMKAVNLILDRIEE